MALPVHFLAEFLIGKWRTVRRIRNNLTGDTGRLLGMASIAPMPGGLSYEERGELRLGSYLGEVSQRYRIVPEGSAAAAVQFADGRPFHRLDLSTGRANVAHDCAADRYCGRYNVVHDFFWTLAWSATGPRKSYVICTGYTRIRE